MITPLQISRINDALHEIHKNISSPLSGKYLASIAAYSEQHFHRLFQQIVGETVNQYIRHTRLEHAANQLLFNPNHTVLEIAESCGFNSLSTFTHVFKARFGSTPGQWRKFDHQQTSPPYLVDTEIAAGYQRIKDAQLPLPNLVTLPDQEVAYVRHQHYGRSIRTAWQILQAWSSFEGRPFDQQIGLHHSNPAWVELSKCRYVACLPIDRPILKRGLVNSMRIPGGLHAAFGLSGKYGELLPWISKILEIWLPNSGFRMQTTPAFVHYKKNQFLDNEELFELTFYLPISIY